MQTLLARRALILLTSLIGGALITPAAAAARIQGNVGVAAGTTGSAGQQVHAIQIGGGPVTVVRFDTLLVDQLGLADVAAHVQSVVTSAGGELPYAARRRGGRYAATPRRAGSSSRLKVASACPTT